MKRIMYFTQDDWQFLRESTREKIKANHNIVDEGKYVSVYEKEKIPAIVECNQRTDNTNGYGYYCGYQAGH